MTVSDTYTVRPRPSLNLSEGDAWDLFNIDEVADILGTSKKTLYNWKNTKRGPNPTKVEGKLLYSRQSITAYLAEHTRGY